MNKSAESVTGAISGRKLTAALLLSYLFSSRKVGLIKAVPALMLGVSGVIMASPTLLVTWPLPVVYLMLVWKELEFSEPILIKGESKSQIVQNIAMVAAEVSFYTFLSHSFGHPGSFVTLMIVFLGLKTIWFERKFLLSKGPAFLRRIIKINVVETICALIALAAIYLHFTQLALIFLGIVITDMSIYFILIRGLKWKN